MTLKEAMQILLETSYCSEFFDAKLQEARRLVELYLKPAEPSMEE